MLRLYQTNLRDGSAPGSVNLGDFDSELPVYVGRGSQDKPVDVKVALRRDGKEIMSRRHCKLFFAKDQDTWIVEDTKAMNGVFVNQERVEGQRALKYGDILQLGGTDDTDSSRIKDVSIRFRLEESDGKGSGKRKRGASQNGADSLTSLNSKHSADTRKSNQSDDEKSKENSKFGSGTGSNSEDLGELVSLRKENKRLKKEAKEQSKSAEEANEEVVSLKQKCSSLRKDNKGLRDDKTKQEKAAREQQELLEETEEDLRMTTDNLEITKTELTETEVRLARLEPTGKSCIDDSALEALVECPLCSKPLLDAVVTACSHGFCRLCLEKRVQDDILKSKACECPVCKTNPMGSRTHMYYFRSKHLDDVVSLRIDASESAKQDFLSRELVARTEMTKLGLDRDARHGSIGVTMGTGSAIEQRAASSKKGPSVMESSHVYAARADSDESAESNDENNGIDTLSKAPPKCSYCGVDDHDEKSCPEQM
jgi:pSer/pThr/pTyr-binding forkhead associated (FHA) protein